MKPGPLSVLILAVALGLPAPAATAALGKPESATALAMKRAADRYALTKAHIAALLGQRLKPAPLPAALPNPFAHPTTDPTPAATLPGGPADNPAPPAGPDESDAGTLAKFVATLRVSGLTVLNDVPFLTLNQRLCKAGDTIPVEARNRTAYIQVLKITPDELTLGLNEERQVVRVRK